MSFFLHCEDFREANKFPVWLTHFTAATKEEDAEGYDAWAHTTDVGKIGVQIKTHERLRTRFLNRENRKHIICIALEPTGRFDLVFSFMLSQLTQARSRLLKAKAQESDS
jgi:hypothetical protein